MQAELEREKERLKLLLDVNKLGIDPRKMA
jgi:hypothetical protein